jgi:hypothetical protein
VSSTELKKIVNVWKILRKNGGKMQEAKGDFGQQTYRKKKS